MNSTLNPKLSDDPHDFVVVPPDAVRVAPSDEEELSGLLHQAARHRADALGHVASNLSAAPTVPPVDTTFRPTAANDPGVPGRSIGGRVLRPLIALLLAGCIGLVAVAWRSYGDTVKKQFAKWTTQAVVTLSMSPEEPAAAEAQPVVLAAAAAEAPNAASPQPEAPVRSAAEAAAPAAVDPSTGSAQQLQSMARELADLGQEVAQLKASLAQLKSSQQQASRDAAKTSEAKASEAKASEAKASEAKAAAAKPSERPRISVTSPPSPRSVEARPRRPAPPPAQAAAPQAPAPYYASRQPDYAPRQPDYYAQRQSDYAPRQTAPQPQFAAEPQGDPEMSSIPRPPMPVR